MLICHQTTPRSCANLTKWADKGDRDVGSQCIVVGHVFGK